LCTRDTVFTDLTGAITALNGGTFTACIIATISPTVFGDILLKTTAVIPPHLAPHTAPLSVELAGADFGDTASCIGAIFVDLAVNGKLAVLNTLALYNFAVVLRLFTIRVLCTELTVGRTRSNGEDNQYTQQSQSFAPKKHDLCLNSTNKQTPGRQPSWKPFQKDTLNVAQPKEDWLEDF
tara:strand:+ start:24357 stop:24896 length:540 start_codon:yes stop_codon:yes gene_type:complete